MELDQSSAWHGIVLGLTLTGFGMGTGHLGRVWYGTGSRLTFLLGQVRHGTCSWHTSAEFCVVLVKELKKFFRTN